jgi:hypothetical protein
MTILDTATLDASELPAIVEHAADALECYAEAGRWHIERAIARGLEGSRGASAMDIAAKRADDVASALRALLGPGTCSPLMIGLG